MEKTQCSMGKLTIYMAIFNGFLYVYQRVLTISFATKTWLNASDEPGGIVGSPQDLTWCRCDFM
jgi:hypothetical protein